MTVAPVKYCTFRLNDLLFGIPAERIQEVVRAPELTPVPLASSLVGGLINLRGQIVMCIDLRRCFGFSPRDEWRERDHVVVETADYSVSLMVDRVGEVVEVDRSCGEDVQKTIQAKLRAMLSGMFIFGDEVLLALDVDRTVDVDSLRTSADAHPTLLPAR